MALQQPFNCVLQSPIDVSAASGGVVCCQWWFFTAWDYTEHGIATASRLSVRLSVTLRYRDHIGWNTTKIISRLHG